jgi:hypothetical protein
MFGNWCVVSVIDCVSLFSLHPGWTTVGFSEKIDFLFAFDGLVKRAPGQRRKFLLAGLLAYFWLCIFVVLLSLQVIISLNNGTDVWIALCWPITDVLNMLRSFLWVDVMTLYIFVNSFLWQDFIASIERWELLLLYSLMSLILIGDFSQFLIKKFNA